ncbi:solute carrier family 23 member 2-like isoform X1 [Ostrea edulis]|uniref:solute carrier family 23 member 2-like isoform X1 n=1 Tax=Ostrea edulis TaxID=37623 RepID=UPI0024AFA62B|nr:solute carrier family 23 member 2-like isoform X1 [Ostrea edulis]XP_048744999.2 solute carrier family 23 member 2-like isoform X1 [Ostrea edulis]
MEVRVEDDQEDREGRQNQNQDLVGQENQIIYSVEEAPPPHLTLVFALQQAILAIGSTLSIPFILTNLLCSSTNADARAQLLSISMFMCGIATVLQTTLGVRLGIIQGGSHNFLAPIIAMMTLEKWKCTEEELNVNGIRNNSTIINEDEIWQKRMREIQGNLMLASIVQLVLGCTGLMGFFLRFIGPLTIAPTISLIGLSLTAVAADINQYHWGIAILTLLLIGIFSLYMGRLKVPVPSFSKANKCHITRFPIFQLMPVILSVVICWLISYILTVTDVIPQTIIISNKTMPNLARTDARLNVLNSMPWFYFPYPFQFGMPTVSAAGFAGMLAATISSVIESVGDYFAAARLSNAEAPPPHAVNRGIAIEGFSSIISGMVGAGHPTTSYSGNIGAIGITKVASRRVFQVAGVILLLSGIIGKFGAVLTLIPDPIIGGTLTVVFGMVGAVGISVLQFMDMSSTRNLTILALSMILGLMVPQWLLNNPNSINTGSEDLDQVLEVLLTTAMFVGGLIGFILDNTVPGSKEERGLSKWRETLDSSALRRKTVQYNLPLVTTFIQRMKCCAYFPISPTFNKSYKNCCTKSKKQKTYELSDVKTRQENGSSEMEGK